MQAVLFALVSFFGWGVGDVFAALVARRMSSAFSALFWELFGSFILASLYIPFARPSLSDVSFNMVLLSFCLSFVAVFGGTYFYFASFRSVNPALVQTISSSFPMISILLSLVFLGERVNTHQAVAIGTIFAGLLLVLFEFSKVRRRDLRVGKGLLFALCPMIAWGIYWAFIKVPVREIGWFWPEYISFFVFALVFLFGRLKNQKVDNPLSGTLFWPYLVSIIIVRTAEFGYNVGLSKGLVAVVAPIAGANPALFVLLSFFVFKEPITRQQLAGIAVTLLGIVLLSFASV